MARIKTNLGVAFKGQSEKIPVVCNSTQLELRFPIMVDLSCCTLDVTTFTYAGGELVLSVFAMVWLFG